MQRRCLVHPPSGEVHAKDSIALVIGIVRIAAARCGSAAFSVVRMAQRAAPGRIRDRPSPCARPLRISPSTDSMSRKNLPAQRQLNEQGSVQTKSIGDSMRKLKIPVGLVLTSTAQRAVDTARLLGFGEITVNPDLAESGPALSPDENNRRAQAFRKLVAARPPADNNLVIVSHKPNIVDAFGKDLADLNEGEALDIRAGWQRWLQADRQDPSRPVGCADGPPGLAVQPSSVAGDRSIRTRGSLQSRRPAPSGLFALPVRHRRRARVGWLRNWLRWTRVRSSLPSR